MLEFFLTTLLRTFLTRPIGHLLIVVRFVQVKDRLPMVKETDILLICCLPHQTQPIVLDFFKL